MSLPTPTVYELRVDGLLDNHWSDWLGEVALRHGSDGVTTICVTVADQAQLHGLLTGVRDLNADLISLRSIAQCSPAFPTLHTERLLLRPAALGDAETTWAYRRLDSVNEWLTGSPSDFDQYAVQFSEPERLAATVVVELEHGDGAPRVLIGDFMLRRENAWAQADVADAARGQQVELGWVLDPAHTGRGYATEAVTALIDHSLKVLGVHRAIANCFLRNTTSWRLMERVGMRRESHAVRDSLHRSGQWLDTVTYAVLREEWDDRRSPGGRTPS
jgi:RimJ/RimL family protein N-acetyltransferase